MSAIRLPPRGARLPALATAALVHAGLLSLVILAGAAAPPRTEEGEPQPEGPLVFDAGRFSGGGGAVLTTPAAEAPPQARAPKPAPTRLAPSEWPTALVPSIAVDSPQDSGPPTPNPGEGVPADVAGPSGPTGPNAAGTDGPGGPSGNGTGTAGVGAGDASGPVRITAEVTPPELLRRVDPDYPQLLRRARVAGSVVLECIVNADGSVSVTRVLNGDPGFVEAATDAVVQWRYRPALVHGEPRDAFLVVRVFFRAR